MNPSRKQERRRLASFLSTTKTFLSNVNVNREEASQGTKEKLQTCITVHIFCLGAGACGTVRKKEGKRLAP